MENISVSIRVRPLSKSESQDAWRVDGNTISQAADRQDVKYPLDHVFTPDFTTQQIYELTARSLIAKVVNGFNSTIFAYVGNRGLSEGGTWEHGRKREGRSMGRRGREGCRGHQTESNSMTCREGASCAR